MASKLVLLDSLISNIDRTAKNPNLLLWKNELWVIDNGASFYFHHNWETWENHLTKTFPLVKDHVLLSQATQLTKASEAVLEALDVNTIKNILSKIPDDWLHSESDALSNTEMHDAYLDYIQAKLAMMNQLVKEAEDAR
jgi:hypothetical protein